MPLKNCPKWLLSQQPFSSVKMATISVNSGCCHKWHFEDKQWPWNIPFVLHEGKLWRYTIKCYCVHFKSKYFMQDQPSDRQDHLACSKAPIEPLGLTNKINMTPKLVRIYRERNCSLAFIIFIRRKVFSNDHWINTGALQRTFEVHAK